jgi:hypothetical protein
MAHAELTALELAAAVATIVPGASEVERVANELRASVWASKDFSLNSLNFLYPGTGRLRCSPNCSHAMHMSIILATRNALRVHHDTPPPCDVFMAAYNAIVASARARGVFDE